MAHLQAVGIRLWIKPSGRLGIDGPLDKLSNETKAAIRQDQEEMVRILEHASEARASGKVAMSVRWAPNEKGVIELGNPLTGETAQILAKGLQERWLFDRLPSKYDI